MYYYGRDKQRRSKRRKRLVLIAFVILFSIIISSLFFYYNSKDAESIALVDPTQASLQSSKKLLESTVISTEEVKMNSSNMFSKAQKVDSVETTNAELKDELGESDSSNEKEKSDVVIPAKRQLPKTEYHVISKAYFYGLPDKQTQKIACLNHWNNSYASINAIKEKNGFIYVIFTNHLGQTTKGWLRKRDLKKVSSPKISSKVIFSSPDKQPIAIGSAAKDTLLKKAMITEANSNLKEEAILKIIERIRKAKYASNNLSNCISIKIVNNSNAENGYKLAASLRQHGFVISGREVVQGFQKGIQILAEGPCVKLTIGNLD